MSSRIFLVKEPSDCEPINALCEKLDKTKEDYEKKSISIFNNWNNYINF